MGAALTVRRSGICSTLQDMGRTGYRAYGVPASGALDAVACRLANLLAGNDPGCAAIEMMYSGVTVELESGTARVAVCGAQASVVGRGRERAIQPWQSARLESGDVLRISTIRDSATAYLAVRGGFDVAPVLGSCATHLRAGLGGFEGRALQRGDILPLHNDHVAGAEQRLARTPDLRPPAELRVMLGPQVHRFDNASVDLLLAAEYRVEPSSDRSGLRLEGPVLTHLGGHDTTSEAVATGSIQVPGSGQPVILIGDHPTVGGYPKIATIISADIPAAGRLRIGSRVRFIEVDEATAASARREAKRMREAIESSLVDVAPGA
jgi:biotin-dependent carboxylase-like uncharacterized protein